MKRLVRFVLLTLGYAIAVVRVAARRINLSPAKGKKRKGIFAGIAIGLLAAIGLSFASPANAYVIGTATWKTVKVGGATSTVTTGQCSGEELVRGFRLNSDSNTGTAFALSMALMCGLTNPDLNGWNGVTNRVQFFGTNPGETGFDSICADGSFAYGVTAKTNRGTNGIRYINDLAPLCRNIKTNSITTTPATAPTGATPNESAECNAGEYLLGLKLQTGSAVDAIIGLRCASYTYVQNSPTNVTATHTNGNTLTVSFTDNSYVENQYGISILDSTGTTTIASTAISPVSGTGSQASVTFSTASYPALQCGLTFIARVIAYNPSGDVTVLNSATVSATSAAYSPCTTSSLSVSSSATSNLWWDSSTNTYKAIAAGSAGVLNVSDLRTRLQTGASGTNTTIASGGALTFSSALTTSGAACGTLTVGSPDSSVMLNAAIDMSSCSSGTPLMVKAATDVLVYANITTNAGAVTLWSDTDAASSRGGGIKTGSGTAISSAGGAISLSGGTDNTASWAKGTSITDDFGISLGGSINAGGGNITIRGEEAADINRTVWMDRAGVNFNKSSSTTTTSSGTITVDGKVDSVNTDTTKNHYGVLIGGADAANLATVTAASGAISIKGDASNNSNANRRGIIMNRATVSSGSGAITLDGAGSTATNGLALMLFADNNSVSSTSGPILLKGNANVGSQFGNGSASSAGGITLQLSNLWMESSSTFTLGGASAKVIESTSSENSFSSSQIWSGLAVSSNSTSLRVGKSTNTSAVTINTAQSVAGSININGGDVTLGAALETTGANNALTVKAYGNLVANSGATMTTAGGTVNLFSDIDGTSGGNVQLGSSATNSPNITTNGGAVTISGGNSTGTGYARGTATASIVGNAGVSFYSDITTAGGSVTIRGQAGTATIDSAAVYMFTGASIDTTGVSSSGNVDITGLVGSDQSQTSAAVRAVRLGAGGSANQAAITVGHSATINVFGDSSPGTASTQDGVLLEGANLTSANGSITISANMAAGDAAPIYITTATSTVGSTGTGVVYIKENSANASTTATYLNNLNLNTAGDAYIIVNRLSTASTSTFTTGGTLRIEPAAAAFPTTLNFPGSAVVGSATAGLIIGKSLTSGSVTLGASNVSIAGPITVIGTVAGVDANATVTGFGNSITIKSADASWTGAGRTIQTNGGNITFWADADVSSSGNILIGDANTFSTAGGKLTLAGGADGGASTVVSGRVSGDSLPDGFAWGTGATNTWNKNNRGVMLDGNETINTAGGAIFIAGHGPNLFAGVGGQGVVLGRASKIAAGSGKIGIYGTTNASGSVSLAFNTGVELQGYGGTQLRPLTISSSNGSADAIEIKGDASASSSESSPGVASINFESKTDAPANFIANTGAGGIQITGRAGTRTFPDLTDMIGDGIELAGIGVLAKSGPISFAGDTSASSSGLSYGFAIDHTTHAFYATTPNYIGAMAGMSIDNVDMSTSTSNITFNVDSLYNLDLDNSKALTTSGAITIAPPSSTQSFDRSVTFKGFTLSSAVGGLILGQSGTGGTPSVATQNTADITISSAVSISGDIEVYGGAITASAALSTSGGKISMIGATVNNSAALSTDGRDISLTADQLTIGAALTANKITSGIVSLLPKTSGKNIDLGAADSSTLLGLTNTELGFVSANVLRVGSMASSANVNVSSNISIASSKVPNFAIRANGNITNSNSATISALNLAINVNGTINLPGSNGVTGNLALVATQATGGSGVSYGSAGNYSVDSVDTIDPIYGRGKNISVSSAPSIGSTEIRYLNQTWSAPPVVTVKDAYGYVLSTQNSTASSYLTTVAKTGAPVLSGTTPVVSGGTQTFSALYFTTNAGNATLTFTTTGLAAGGTASVTTGTYDVQGAEPQSIAIASTSTSAQAGKTGFGLTATLKDSNGNTVTGPHATDAITVSVSGGSAPANYATIVSGGTASTVAGRADFSNLILGGKVATNYTLTFSVTYTDFNSTVQTKTATQVVTLTYGDATKLAVTTQAAGFANRSNFTTQPAVSVQDAWGNTVTSSTASVAVAVTAVGTASTQGLTGTTTKPASGGVATFTDLGKTGTIGDKRLTFTSTGLSSDTQDFTLTFGAAYQLAMTSPATTVNDNLFGTQPVVTIQDQDGNTVADSTATVTLSSSNATVGGTLLSSAVAMNANSGVANFSGRNVKLTGSTGSKYLTATIPGGLTVTNSVTITFGAATQLAIVQQAAGAVNGLAFSTQPQVVFQDISGNTVDTTDSIDVSSSGAVLGGTHPVAAVAGKTTFTNLKLTGTIGTYQLIFTSGSLTSLPQDITVTFGAATKLVLTTSPVGFENRTNFSVQPVITVQDASGNTVTNASMSIDVSSDTADLTGTLRVNVVNGIATFVGLGNAGTVGAKHLTFKKVGGGLTEAVFDYILTHGTATKIVVSRSAAGAKSGQAFATQPKIQVQDADSNLVTTGVASTAKIRLTVSSDAYDANAHTGVNLTGPTSFETVDAVAGEATFADARLEGVVAAAYVLKYTIVNTAGFDGLATAQNIALTAGTETHLDVVQQPTAIVAGAAFSPVVTVQILDAWNNRVLDVANTVTVKPTLVDDALASNVLDSSKSAVANSSGLVTFTGLTFTKAGTQFIQFTSTGLVAATSTGFAIANAQAHHLVWVTSPVGAKNDYAIKGDGNANPELEIRDEYENPVVTGAATSVDVTEPTSNTNVISISGGSARNVAGSARVIFSNLVLRAKVGSYTLRFTAANGSLPINGTHIDSSAAVAITFGDPSALRLTRSAAGANVGAAFTTQPKLNIEDTAGNVVADSTLAVTVSENETQVLAGTQTKNAVAGSVDFTDSGLKLSGAVATGLTLKYVVTNNSSEISTTQLIDLNPGLAVALTIGQQPTTVKTRVAFNPVPTVVLRDASGNQVTGDSASTVTAQLKDSSGNPVGAETSAFTASGGLVTFTGLAFQAPSTSGYYVTFKLVSNGQAVTSNAFDILPGVATELRITRQPSTDTVDHTPGKTGELLSTQPIVKLYDQDGNLVTTANSGAVTVRVKSTDAAGDLSEGAVTASITGGIATFAGVKFVGTPGVTYTLDFATATPNPTLTSVASTTISVTHNDATHLVVTRAASGGRSGRAFTVQPIVTIKDRYENTVTTGPDANADIRANGEITAPNAGVSNPSDDTATAIDGVATFGALGLTGLVSNTYKLNFNLVGSNTVSGVSQSNITISYGTANQLALTTQPLGGNATGQHLATQPVVEIRDGAGNKVANSTLTVSASIVSTSGLILADGSAARLVGATNAAVAGVASFDALDLYGLPGTDYTLKFTVTGLGFATANPLQVTHAVAHHLAITAQPAGGNPTGANLSGQPVVQLRDAFENVVSGDSTDVLTARLSTTSSSETLDGSTTATFDHGVATFAGLKVIALPETNYTLDFTTTVGGNTITSVASSSFQVTYATATKLAVYQQPVSGTTGTQLTTQPIIEVQDFYGNRVRNFSGVVSASVGGTGVTLSNSTYAGGGNALEMAVVDGRATFTGLELTGVPATDYQLTFASNTLTSVNSGNIRVTPGAPVRIEIVNQPIGSQTGAALAGQPVVKIVDSFGNTVTQNSSTVITAALTSGTGGTLTRVVSSNSVAITATTVNGVATFSNLYMRGLTNHDYRITFSSGDLASAVSATYQVSHAAITQLVWNTQPAVDKTGSPLTRAAVLELQDLDGNIADTDSSTVVTAVVTSGAGASPLQNATATADHGVVTFNNLTLTGTPGTAYKLTFTAVVGSTSFSAPPSDDLVLAHAIPAKLTMRGGNVTGGLTGQDLTSQPTLYVRDRFNNIATSDNSTVVTASIYNDQTGAVSGNVTARAVNGEITFAGLKASGVPGTAYTLRFTGDWNGTTLTAVNSNSFTVSKRADVSLAYTAQQYVPSAVVHPAFSADSPGTVTYSTASSSAICSLNTSNGDITINGVGTCAVRVDVAATTYYLAHYAEASLVISKANQAPVTITSPASVNFWSTLTPAASGGTGTGAIFFSVNGSCRIVGTTLIPGDAGSLCQLSATRMGDANYLAASPDFQTITINKLAQSTLSIVAASEMTVGTLELFTAGGSGSGAVTFGVNPGDASRCSITGSTLTASASGNCRITARKASSTNYDESNLATASVRVNFDIQNVAFTSTAPSFPVALGSYTPTASATSTLPVTFSIVTSNTTPACAFDLTDARKINFLTSGDCEIVATQAGSSRYAAATVSQRIRVGVLNQTINFAAITDKSFGTPAFQLSASSNSGLNVSIATTSNSTACSISNLGLVTLTAAGLCELEATQAGNNTYAAATPVIRTFSVTADFAGAPHIFSSSASTHAFTVAFTAPSYTGGASITAYALTVTDADGNVFENAACPAGSSPVTCTIVGISNDIAYTAVVRAITIAGMGAPSNVSMPQTPVDAPVAVTNLSAATTNNDLVVTWSPPKALDGTFTRYEVYVAPIGSDLPVTPTATETNPSATGTTIANIVPAAPTPSPTTQSLRVARASGSIAFRRASVSTPTPTSSSSSNQSSAPVGYKVSVVTITQSSSSASSNNTSSGVQTGFTTPLAPSRLTLDPIGNKLLISWSAPTSDGGSPLTGYDVKVNGAVICGATTFLACEFDGMALGRNYVVEVTAINAIGSGIAARDSYSTPAPPAQAGSAGSSANSAISANGMAILSGSRKTASTKGGELLTLHTRNFAGVTSALLDGKPLKIVSNSEDQITVELPEHAAGSVDLTFKSRIGMLVYQDAITFVAPPRAAVSQTFSRYGLKAVAVNARAVASIRAVVNATEAPKAMVCVGLVPAQHSLVEVKLARARAAALCAVGAKLDGNLVVRATTGITKQTGAAARTVQVTFTY